MDMQVPSEPRIVPPGARPTPPTIVRSAESHPPISDAVSGIAAFTAGETHLPYLTPGTLPIICSEALGWRPAHAGVLMEAPGDADLPALGHPSLVFCVRGGGALRLRSGGLDLRGCLRPGHFVLLPPDESISWSAAGGGETLRLSLRPAVLQAAAARIEGADPTAGVITRPLAFITDARLEQMVRLIRDALRAGVTDEQCVEGLVLGVASGLLRLQSALIRRSGPPSPEPIPCGALAPWRVRKVIAYMHEKIGETVTLPELARVAGLSTSHLSHGFKASTGEAPMGFHLRLRVARALELLAAAEMPLAQVALACGFSSQSHFTTMFRRQVGVTPGRWQERRRS